MIIERLVVFPSSIFSLFHFALCFCRAIFQHVISFKSHGPWPMVVSYRQYPYRPFSLRQLSYRQNSYRQTSLSKRPSPKMHAQARPIQVIVCRVPAQFHVFANAHTVMHTCTNAHARIHIDYSLLSLVHDPCLALNRSWKSSKQFAKGFSLEILYQGIWLL